MTLAVDLRQRLGRFALDVRFESAGRLTVLFGASGSGKTSVVNLVAGLTRPSGGRIVVDGRILLDTETGVFLPKHRRKIGYVFQDARLFPHLDVRQNLLYGRWFTPLGERYQKFGDVVDLLGIGPLLTRRPAHLSGGERQRVAIGRALLSSPRLLLMDEPLAALDAARKAELLPYVERLRDEARIPILYVSHSVSEVLRLACDLVVLEAGSVVAHGPAAEVLRRLDLAPSMADEEPGSVIDTLIASHDPAGGLTCLDTPAGPLHVPLVDAPVAHPVRIRIRARDVMIAVAEPEGLSALNVILGRIAQIAPSGPASVDVALDCGPARIVARITRRSCEALALSPGATVFAVVKAVSFDRSRGANPPGSADRFGFDP